MTFEKKPRATSSRTPGHWVLISILSSPKKKLFLDYVRIERNEIQETGEQYDLEGIFVRLNYAIESLGAKRVVLDTIESLFSGLCVTV